MSYFKTQVDRNLMGKLLEKKGKILEAKALYEANISEDFEGSFPYRRLAIIYRKEKSKADEIRVLNKALVVFNSLIPSERKDVDAKLREFREALRKAKSKM
ncbi:hypothetical protein [Ulvibacterium marinum]|uniref:Tetratricopeptide repeat protein n=1 Tax=Ulvibacterium marinum TaxID=2419782 RepID=A0A3B0C627_9FLAO|nr:hypothetical protein [Ulvibacterium marinum]RKN81042.1 hypothetical protein D7Z94_08815 [Ulvibacterium marinum]